MVAVESSHKHFLHADFCCHHTHGKSWNSYGLEAVPGRAQKGDWESQAGIKTPTFSDKSWTGIQASEDRGALLVLSGNMELTTDKKALCVQKRSHWIGLYQTET